MSVPIRRIKVHKIVPGEDVLAWSDRLAAGDWLTRSRPLKQAHPSASPPQSATPTTPSPNPGAQVLLTQFEGRTVIIKSRPLTRLADRARLALGSSRSHRQWAGADALAAIGVAAARPILIARAEVDAVPTELLLLDHVPGRTLLSWAAEAARPRRAATRAETRRWQGAARAAGEMAAVLRDAGLLNRDGKPSNLVVDEAAADGGGGVGLVVLDTVGVRRIGKLDVGGGKALVRMLASLVIEPIGTGVRPSRAVMMRVVRAAAAAASGEGEGTEGEREEEDRLFARQLWMSVAAAVERHGDPTPSDNPLMDE